MTVMCKPPFGFGYKLVGEVDYKGEMMTNVNTTAGLRRTCKLKRMSVEALQARSSCERG
jgi:hypothetical protein